MIRLERYRSLAAITACGGDLDAHHIDAAFRSAYDEVSTYAPDRHGNRMSRAGRLWTVLQRPCMASTPACPIEAAPLAWLTADGFGRTRRELLPLAPLGSLCRSDALQSVDSVVELNEVN